MTELLNKYEKILITFKKEVNLALSIVKNLIPHLPGVYTFIAVKNGEKELVYFGIAGMNKSGEILTQQLPGRLQNTRKNEAGKEMSTEKFLIEKIEGEQLDYVEICCYITWHPHNGHKDNPHGIKKQLYETFRSYLPRWMKERGRKVTKSKLKDSFS